MNEIKIFPKTTRREFFKQSLLGLIGWSFTKITFPFFSLDNDYQRVASRKGRVLKEGVTLFSNPSFKSRPLGQIRLNSIVDLIDSLQGQSDSHNNAIWYKIASSLYLHSSSVQPVENLINPVEMQVSRYGQLAQVTVPFTRAWKAPLAEMKEFVLVFYGSNHWVTGLQRGPDGRFFYQIDEDRWQETYFIPADHLHLFTNEELRPVQSTVLPEEKRLVVDLNRQQLTAYENEKIVFQSPISSGFHEGNHDYSTPPGEYRITLKRPSRHMIHSDRFSDADSDLYGVPWVCNFTDTGIAFHGTYWHNEFTYPHSHGCINLPIEAARWVYLWSDPFVPARERKFVTNHGTRVTVH